MSFTANQSLGIGFALLAGVLTFLMYYAWGFPYDKERNHSTAPRRVLWAHRLLGYLFVAIYLYLMWQMVPRLWTYQIELPARTVAHLLLGMSIGAMLIAKIVIVRFFKHLEARLVPFLGTGLFICAILLIGLALPVTLREAYLRDAAVMGDSFSTERLDRVREQLPKAGLDDDELLSRLATSDGLMSGRQILVQKCTQCHDLRTVLARPRTPQSWRDTVERMANRSTILRPITEAEQWQVTAYLVAISPTLQRTLRQKRTQDMAAARSQAAVATAAERMQAPAEGFDLSAAKEVFLARCSQCHSPLQVDGAPPRSAEAAAALVTRMVRNGLQSNEEDLETVIRYLTATYASAAPAAATPALAPPEAASAPGGSAADAESPAAPGTQTVTLSPHPTDLAFDPEIVTARTGTKLRIVFDNTAAGASLTHNFALLAVDDVADDVVTAALGSAGTGYLPEHPDLLAGVPATDAGSRRGIVIDAPPPGRYQFICLMPGHSFTMRGELAVSP